MTGTYTIASNCTASATLTDTNSNTYAMSFSIYSVLAANTHFYASLARAGNFLMTGGAHAEYLTAVDFELSALHFEWCLFLLHLSGRGIAGGNFTGSFQGIGTATFDGDGHVTLAGTVKTNLAQGKTFSYTGTYTLPASCSGTLTVTTTSATTFTFVVWSGVSQFNFVGV